MGTAATQGNQHIALPLLVGSNALLNIFIGRIGNGLIKHGISNVGLIKQISHLLGVAQLSHAFISDNQRLFTTQWFHTTRQLRQHIRTE